MRSITKIFIILFLLSLVPLTGCKGGMGGAVDTSPLSGDNNNGTGNNNNTTGPLTISWDAPTQNTDGSPASIAGYKIYYGISSGLYTGALDVGNVTSYTVDLSIAPGTYYIAVTAYDASGNESDFSNEVSSTF